MMLFKFKKHLLNVLKNALLLLQILKIDASVSHSTSAIDAVGCFHQVNIEGLG